MGSGVLSMPQIGAQNSYSMEWKSGPWHSSWTSSVAEEIFLTLDAKLLHSTRWVESGHIVSSVQLQLPSKREPRPHVRTVFLAEDT